MIHTHYQKPDANYNRRHLMAVASIGASIGGALGVAGPMTFGSSLALGTLGVGAAGYLGSTLLGRMSQSPSMPSAPAALPAAPTYSQAEAVGQQETLDLARRKRAGTTLTSPQGLLSTDPVTSKTLLGA